MKNFFLNQKQTATLVIFLFFAVLISMAFDFLYDPGATASVIGLGPTKIMAFAIFAQIGYQYLFKTSPFKRYSKLLFAASSLLAAGSFVMYCMEIRYFANYLFSVYGFHPSAWHLMTLYLSATTLVSDFLIPNNKLGLWEKTTLPFLILMLMLAFSQRYQPLYQRWATEDSLFEYATAVLYVVLAMIGAANLRLWYAKRPPMNVTNALFVISHLLLILGGLLIGGEEISWGQRIFDIATPEHLVAQNTQGELNLHNNRAIFGYVYYAYFWLAVYGCVAWAIVKLINKTKLPAAWQKLIAYWAPAPELFGYFLPMAVLIFIRQRLSSFYTDPWEEFIELVIVIGLVLFMWMNYIKLKARKAA